MRLRLSSTPRDSGARAARHGFIGEDKVLHEIEKDKRYVELLKIIRRQGAGKYAPWRVLT